MIGLGSDKKNCTFSFLKSPFVVCKKTFSTLFTKYPSLFVKIASSVCKVSERRGQYWHFFNTLFTDCTSPVCAQILLFVFYSNSSNIKITQCSQEKRTTLFASFASIFLSCYSSQDFPLWTVRTIGTL